MTDGVEGFSSGAPDSRCNSMKPGHGPDSLELSDSPYTLTIAGQTASGTVAADANGQISVKVTIQLVLPPFYKKDHSTKYLHLGML